MYSDGLLKLPIFTIQKNHKILLTVYSLSPHIQKADCTGSPRSFYYPHWSLKAALRRSAQYLQK